MSTVSADVERAFTMADLTKVLQNPNVVVPPSNQNQPPLAAAGTALNRSFDLPAPPVSNTFSKIQAPEAKPLANTAGLISSPVWNDWVELKLSSPVDKLRALKKGFDGYRADPPSVQTLNSADKIWLYVRKFTEPGKAFPRIEAGSEDFVEFRWCNGQNDSFELWIYGKPGFFVEWSGDDGTAGQSNNFVEVVKVIQNYLS